MYRNDRSGFDHTNFDLFNRFNQLMTPNRNNVERVAPEVVSPSSSESAARGAQCLTVTQETAKLTLLKHLLLTGAFLDQAHFKNSDEKLGIGPHKNLVSFSEFKYKLRTQFDISLSGLYDNIAQDLNMTGVGSSNELRELARDTRSSLNAMFTEDSVDRFIDGNDYHQLLKAIEIIKLNSDNTFELTPV